MKIDYQLLIRSSPSPIRFFESGAKNLTRQFSPRLPPPPRGSSSGSEGCPSGRRGPEVRWSEDCPLMPHLTNRKSLKIFGSPIAITRFFWRD
ncbi:hypothetical protein E2C01_087726 [Portunus trituberculatus]|uniref:Uncharacterized protein n=1 Tax=Portunus trituberculatus TaxID=210409 RepID=A0A5B7JEV3_PORTR|nr:hypothetical protein [Portunus trituberculatus]